MDKITARIKIGDFVFKSKSAYSKFTVFANHSVWMMKIREKASATLLWTKELSFSSNFLSISQLAASIICDKLIPNFEVGNDIANSKMPKIKIRCLSISVFNEYFYLNDDIQTRAMPIDFLFYF